MLTFNVPCRQFFSHTCNVAESGFVHPPNRIPDKIPKNIHRVSVFSRMISQGCLATEPYISPFLFLAIFVYHGRNWALTLGICRNWVSCYSVWAAEMFSKWDSDPLLTYIQAENYPISRMLKRTFLSHLLCDMLTIMIKQAPVHHVDVINCQS